MTVTAWVIGAGGLLGSALTRALAQRDGVQTIPSPSLPWSDAEELRTAVTRQMELLCDSADAADGQWQVLWAGGAAVTSSPAEAFDREIDQFSIVLDAIGDVIRTRGSSGHSGVFFFASSAGGVYAGSTAPPFTESSEPAPISPYGDFKLRAEALVNAFSIKNDVSALVGRIANLYGPGQSLDKMQGLISHIAKAQLSPVPASIYVSLDTVRDYIFVDDCAELIIDCLDKLREVSGSGTVRPIKNLCSGQAVTIAAILGYFRTIAKGSPHVMLGSSAAAALQARDLRIASTVWPELDARELTPLPTGIHATLAELRREVQRSRTF